MLCDIVSCESGLLSDYVWTYAKRAIYAGYNFYLYDVWFWHGDAFGLQYAELFCMAASEVPVIEDRKLRAVP